MAIAFPLARSVFADRLKIAAFRWQLLPFVETSGTGLGQVITNEIAPRRWRAEVELARMPHAEAAEIQALIDALGPSGTFYLHNPAQLGPRDDPTGAALAGHAVAINATERQQGAAARRAAGGLHACAAATCCTSTTARARPAGRCTASSRTPPPAAPGSPASSRCGRSSRPAPPPAPSSPWSGPSARMMLEPGSFDPGTEGPVNTTRHGLQRDRGPLMRAVDPAAQALRAERGGLAERVMVWIAARHRLPASIEALGLWSGEDSRDDHRHRPLDRGAGDPGLPGRGVASRRRRRSSTRPGCRCGRCGSRSRRSSEPVIDAVRLYDPRGARVQIWRRTLSPDTGLPGRRARAAGSRASATGRRSRARSRAARRSSRWRWSRPCGC